jgi:hypothetical protein
LVHGLKKSFKRRGCPPPHPPRHFKALKAKTGYARGNKDMEQEGACPEDNPCYNHILSGLLLFDDRGLTGWLITSALEVISSEIRQYHRRPFPRL